MNFLQIQNDGEVELKKIFIVDFLNMLDSVERALGKPSLPNVIPVNAEKFVVRFDCKMNPNVLQENYNEMFFNYYEELQKRIGAQLQRMKTLQREYEYLLSNHYLEYEKACMDMQRIKENCAFFGNTPRDSYKYAQLFEERLYDWNTFYQKKSFEVAKKYEEVQYQKNILEKMQYIFSKKYKITEVQNDGGKYYLSVKSSLNSNQANSYLIE